jgi:hypothetical protein
MTNDESMTNNEIVGRLCQTPWHFAETFYNHSSFVISSTDAATSLRITRIVLLLRTWPSSSYDNSLPLWISRANVAGDER